MGRAAAALAGLALALGSAAVSAQDAHTEPRFTFALSAGLLHAGTLQGQPVRVERLGEEGAITDAMELDRSIRLRGGPRVLVAATAALPAGWVAGLAASYGQGTLRRSYSGDEDWATSALELDVAGSRDVRVIGVEAGLRYTIPIDHPFRPFLELGVTREEWRQAGGDDEPVPGAEALTGGVSRYGVHIAMGGDYPLTDRLSARVRFTNRFQRTPLAPLDPGTAIASGDSLAIHALPPPARPFADAAAEMITSLRFTLGVSYSLGRGAARPEDPVESDASPSDPPR
jgi:hypothetical protein